MANMDEIKEWKGKVQPALESKTSEFHLLGYDRVTSEEVWECLLARLERKKETYRLYQLVAAIMSLSVNEYMNWLTIRAYQGPDLFEEGLPLSFDEN